MQGFEAWIANQGCVHLGQDRTVLSSILHLLFVGWQRIRMFEGGIAQISQLLSSPDKSNGAEEIQLVSGCRCLDPRFPHFLFVTRTVGFPAVSHRATCVRVDCRFRCRAASTICWILRFAFPRATGSTWSSTSKTAWRMMQCSKGTSPGYIPDPARGRGYIAVQRRQRHTSDSESAGWYLSLADCPFRRVRKTSRSSQL